MEPQIDTGIIYSATCKITGKSYIGQAKDYKYKEKKPYLYGLKGRWSDHVSSSSDTPFHKDLKKYGEESFILNFLLRCNMFELDAWEAKIIDHNNTLVPNGYNVARHSRVKNREKTNLAEFYLSKAISLEMKPIKEKGVNRLVYLYIEDFEGNKTRITFGQGKESSFDDAIKEGYKFISPFKDANIPISIHPEILGVEDNMVPYYKKIAFVEKLMISQILVSKNKSKDFDLIVLKIVYIIDDKDQTMKICFGGKNINTLNAYNTAKQFINRVKKKDTIITETNFLQKFLKSATGSCE